MMISVTSSLTSRARSSKPRADATPSIQGDRRVLLVDVDQEYPAVTLPRYFSGQVQRDEALTFALQSARDHYDVLYARRDRIGISKSLTKHSVLDDPKLL